MVTSLMEDPLLHLEIKKGRSLRMLAKFCPLLTTYLPLIDIGENFSLLL